MCVDPDGAEDRGGSNDAMYLIAALLLTLPSVANPPPADNAQFDEPSLDGRQATGVASCAAECYKTRR